MSARAAWRLETLGRQVYRYTAGKVDWVANGLPSEGTRATEARIADLMQRDVPTCSLDATLGSIQHLDLCVVVNASGVVLGDVRGNALRCDPDRLVADVMNPGPSTYRPNVSVHQMHHHLKETRAKRVLVTTADGVLLGLLLKSEVDGAVLALQDDHE